MTTGNDADNQPGFWRSLFRRGSESIEIADHHTGDLSFEGPLVVAAGGTVEGNIRAPQVSIAGLVYGSVVTHNLVLEPGGQLWGDAVATNVEILPGGKLRGWVATLSSEDYKTLMTRAIEEPEILAPEALPGTTAQLPSAHSSHLEVLENGLPSPEILELFQDEAGAARLAHSRLEQAFDERVQEEAARVLARSEALEAALADAQKKITQLEKALNESLDAEAESQHEAELAEIRSLLELRLEALQELEARHEAKTQALVEAERQNEQLEARLAELMNETEVMGRRVESLESALQASVQHNADQEEALLHWQELVQTTQSETAALAAELQSAKAELRNREELVAALRFEQEEFLQSWEQAQGDVAGGEANGRDGEHDGEAEALDSDGQHKGLEAVRAELQNQQEQLLWYRASLTTIQGELLEAERRLRERSVSLEQIRERARRWQDRSGRLAELLYESVQQVKEREASLVELRTRLATVEAQREAGAVDAGEQPRQQLREREAQVRVLEADVDQLREQLATQGERLAEARAEMAELRVALQAAQSKLQERSQQVEKVQRLAQRRIKRLEAKLAAAGGKRAGGVK